VVAVFVRLAGWRLTGLFLPGGGAARGGDAPPGRGAPLPLALLAGFALGFCDLLEGIQTI